MRYHSQFSQYYYIMDRRASHRRRDNSLSDSSSSYYESESEDLQALFKSLKAALINDQRIGKYIYSINKSFKNNVGIVRVSLPQSFSFNQSDIEEFFRKYGKIQKIILKQNRKGQASDNQSIAYIIYSEYFSAVLAVKILNSMEEKERIITAKICHSLPSSNQRLFSEPILNNVAQDYVLQIDEEHDQKLADVIRDYKYVGTIGLDLNDKDFHLRERILGINGCNFTRIYYLCQKVFKFEHEGEQSRLDDLALKLLVNQSLGTQRDVLVISHSLGKYNQAVRFLHELMEQIVEQYKNSREKSGQIIPKDVHVRKWEKFKLDPQLKFLT